MWRKVTYKKWGGQFFKAPEGSHAAIIVGMYEWGTIENKHFWNENDTVFFEYEFEAEVNTAKEWEPVKMEDKVITIFAEYTFTIGDKSKLWKALSWISWLPIKSLQNIDIEEYLWKECSIAVKVNWDWSNVDTVSALVWKQAQLLHERKNDLVYASIEKWEFDLEKYDRLPEFQMKKVRETAEYNTANWIETLDWDDLAFMDKDEKSEADKEFEAILEDEPKTQAEAREKAKENPEWVEKAKAKWEALWETKKAPKKAENQEDDEFV